MKLNYCAGGTTLGPTLTLGRKEEVFGYMLNSFNISTVGVTCPVVKFCTTCALGFPMGSLARPNPYHPYDSCSFVIGVRHKDRGEIGLVIF